MLLGTISLRISSSMGSPVVKVYEMVNKETVGRNKNCTDAHCGLVGRTS